MATNPHIEYSAPAQQMHDSGEGSDYDAEVRRVRDSILRNLDRAAAAKAMSEAYQANEEVLKAVFLEWEGTAGDGLAAFES